MSSPKLAPVALISTAGTPAATVNATFNPQFLALLSEHLYSSPNKAFEELISNSWDANATNVYVRVPDDLISSNAAIWILDNGDSMDVSGLAQLWSIAESKKRSTQNQSNRKQIGKFGIGKLATYVLANELTYICKASDGVIRIVTMDYRLIDNAKSSHLEQLPLTIREIGDLNELEAILSNYEYGYEIIKLIRDGIPNIKKDPSIVDEFGGPPISDPIKKSCWTLAILTSLKREGRDLQEGWIRRLLRTALPLGSSITIEVNGQVIQSSKLDKPIQKSWQIGPELEFDDFELEDGTVITVKKLAKPYPHVVIDVLGEVTGTATLYESNIRGGKSDKISDSNGFFVNVLGRVVNPEDNLFKLSDLNLSVLSQFRAAVRVDSLDRQISANRETIAESVELRVVRSLLRKLFNLGRREYNKIEDKKFTAAGKVVKDDIGKVPIAPLSELIKKSFDNEETFPPFVKVESKEDYEAEKTSWLSDTKEDLSNSINNVEFRDNLPQSDFVNYDLKSRTIVINKNHPFTRENTTTTEQINTLKDTAIVDLLTDAYILNSGISTDIYEDITQHKDRVRRLIAQIRRNSAAQLIATLSAWSDDAKPFEHIVGDALEYLGFTIERMGGSGEPEGVATAYLSPLIDDVINSYSLTYDAKATKHGKAKTSNLNIAGLARHKKDHNAEFSLVVAPNFQDGALQKEAKESKITPISGSNLAKLISITIGFGPISLNKLRGIFELYDPLEVDAWITSLEQDLNTQSTVHISTLVKSLEMLVTKSRMDILGCDAIAQKYREITNAPSRPTRNDIAQVFRGLSLIAPNSVFIDPQKGWDVFIFTHPSMLIKELQRQTQAIPNELKLGALSEDK